MDGILADIGLTSYNDILSIQRSLNRARNDDRISDVLIFNEHEDVYTVGIHRNPEEIVDNSVELVQVERGGSITYHGPGQLVVYFIVSLKDRKTNVKVLIESVQNAINRVLSGYGINSEGRLGRETGVWVADRKICSIGFAIRETSTLHGIALNISTDLSKFQRVMPCGFSSSIMTSVEAETGRKIDFKEVREELKKALVHELEFDSITELKSLESLKRLI